MFSIGYVNIPVEQLMPVHPLAHIQVLGAIHCSFVPHGRMQIAVCCYKAM